MANNMGIVDQVIDFFTRLVKGRIDGATITAQSRVRSATARARTAAARGVNGAIDGTARGARDRVTNRGSSGNPPPSGGGSSGSGSSGS